MSILKTLPAAVLLAAFAGAPVVAPAFAMAEWFPYFHHGHGGDKGGGKGQSGPVSHSAPGPILGIGLPVVAVVGGYVWLRRRNRNNTGKQ